MQSVQGKKDLSNNIMGYMKNHLGVQAPEMHTGTVIHTVISIF